MLDIWIDPDTGIEWWDYEDVTNYTHAHIPIMEEEFSDLRLPSLHEMISLLDHSQGTGTYFKENCPFQGSGMYWTATSSRDSVDKIWTVCVDDGHIYPSNINNKKKVLMVKGK